MADNFKDELRRLMNAHIAKKAEEARIAKQAQQRIEDAQRARVLEKAAEVEVHAVTDIMRKNASEGRDSYSYDLGRIEKDTYTDERGNVIEAALRAGGITKIVRKQEQRRAPYRDDIETHLVMEIGW